MDQVDRVANRVSLAALAGLLGGASMATYKGSPLPLASIRMAGSCAIVATACFGIERISYIAMQQLVDTNERQSQQNGTTLLYVSHAIGGMVGGGVTAALFHRRPTPGMLLCTPLMLGVAHAQQWYDTARQERLREMYQLQKNNDGETTNDVENQNEQSM